MLRMNLRSLTIAAIALVGLLAAPQLAEAGCKINIYIKNTGTAKLQVSDYAKWTAAKIKGGVWRALRAGFWFSSENNTPIVAPGEREGDDYNASFSCSKKRRYRIKYTCKGGAQKGNSFTDYFPSANGWTTKTSFTVKLGRCN